jgi:hypothetical protein
VADHLVITSRPLRAGRVRADAQRERDELREATQDRIAALEETRTALRIRAERAV